MENLHLYLDNVILLYDLLFTFVDTYLSVVIITICVLFCYSINIYKYKDYIFPLVLNSISINSTLLVGGFTIHALDVLHLVSWWKVVLLAVMTHIYSYYVFLYILNELNMYIPDHNRGGHFL